MQSCSYPINLFGLFWRGGVCHISASVLVCGRNAHSNVNDEWRNMNEPQKKSAENFSHFYCHKRMRLRGKIKRNKKTHNEVLIHLRKERLIPEWSLSSRAQWRERKLDPTPRWKLQIRRWLYAGEDERYRRKKNQNEMRARFERMHIYFMTWIDTTKAVLSLEYNCTFYEIIDF